MTEEEAKTKFCPFARNGDEEDCLGSACMAWRWADRFGMTDGDPETRHGYCGLAGKP